MRASEDSADPQPDNDEHAATSLEDTAPALPGAASFGREPGRRGKQGETRARLIRVAIELLRGEGLSALTTSRIAKAAGIAQPGFYAHFKNIDELVSTAVLEVLGEMRRKSSATRRGAFERLQTHEDLANIVLMRQAFADGLEMLLADPTFAELLLRYRRDPSLLGGLLREAARHTREDLTNDIWTTAQRFGFRAEHYPQVAFWSEQILGLFLTAAEALLDGRYTDRAALIDSITRSSFAIMVANVQAAGLHHLLQRQVSRPPASS